MRVLGIETSCDETSVAIVDDRRTILCNLVRSQLDEHRDFHGVVPENAARAHMDHLGAMVPRALDEAGLTFADIDAIAATAGPGLIGGVMVGVMMGKSLAMVHEKPFLAVNHLEGHALTPRLCDETLQFPYLLLLVSGGHTQILIVHDVGKYTRLGTTLDDAIGEAFDKSAKLMGLGYPGGPAVERLARLAKNPQRFELPRPLTHQKNCHFSFSGLKTAMRNHIETLPKGAVKEQDAADLCSALQMAIGDVLVSRLNRAIDAYLERTNAPEPCLVVAGGVAANLYLRGILNDLTESRKLRFIAPPVELCSDNAAMIAWAGLERFQHGLVDGLDFKPRPRWPLDPDAPPAIGTMTGKSGVKA